MQNRTMQIGNKLFTKEDGPYVMGILNVTPDSFSDGGAHFSLEEALRHTERMIAEGASIIDVGGESTRPGYTQISDEEEIQRVCPVIEEIQKRFDVAISLDTYKSKVASAGLQAGAHLINDIWGGTYDQEILSVVAKAGAAICLMHNRKEAVYGNFMEDVLADLQNMVDAALAAGISAEKIMVDPGVGFAKDYTQNLLVMKHVGALERLGYPILLGTSRKSMIGNALGLPVNERVEGTLATTVYGYENGCDFFRVHDVKENMRVLKMIQTIRAT